MGVKVDVTNGKEITYPCIMHTDDYRNLMVLMTSFGNGMQILNGRLLSQTGGCDWDMKQFKPFTGSITLSNE